MKEQETNEGAVVIKAADATQMKDQKKKERTWIQ